VLFEFGTVATFAAFQYFPGSIFSLVNNTVTCIPGTVATPTTSLLLVLNYSWLKCLFAMLHMGLLCQIRKARKTHKSIAHRVDPFSRDPAANTSRPRIEKRKPSINGGMV